MGFYLTTHRPTAYTTLYASCTAEKVHTPTTQLYDRDYDSRASCIPKYGLGSALASVAMSMTVPADAPTAVVVPRNTVACSVAGN